MFETIKYEVKDSIATITINRPDSGNALLPESFVEIEDAMNEASDDKDVRVIILTGAGNFFCTGGDVKNFGQMLLDEQPIPEESVIQTGNVIRSIVKNKKPVIAAVNGTAAGAGSGLVMAADFIIMQDSATIHTAFIQMGFPGDTGLAYLLQQSIGVQRAKRHMMLNEPIDANLGHKYGLLYDVASSDKFDQVVDQLAEKLVKSPINTIGRQKRLFATMLYPKADETNKVEAEEMHNASKHAEHAEAVHAYMEKRAPRF